MPEYNVLLVGIDSLRRDFLGAYAQQPHCVDYDVATPNLDRFAERALVFDNHYAGSLPCIPQRREFLCGIQEFLWRPWGPVEAYDRTVPSLAGSNGITTQLVTDHYHYFEEGGTGYYEDFHGFEFVRGHEHDAWKTAPRYPEERLLRQCNRRGLDSSNPAVDDSSQYARNVSEFDELDERDYFAPKVFTQASKWVRDNYDEWDQWFCYVDSFDVHEPFHCPEPYASMYTDEDPTDPDLVTWPDYASLAEQGMTDRQLEFVTSQFAGKVTMVDRWFGRLLDRLDRTGAWEDTVVVVTTDHGEMLGEHGYIMKNYMPVFDEIAHTPLLIYHPEGRAGRTDALTSSVDLYATMLDAMDVSVPSQTHSRSLDGIVAGETDEGREYTVYGYFRRDLCITDGRYTYFHPGDDSTVDIYSTMQMGGEATDADAATLPYTDAPVWRYPAGSGFQQAEEPTLFDTETDPRQTRNVAEEQPEQRERMRDLLVEALDELEAPSAQYERLGLA